VSLTNVWLQTRGDGLVRADQVAGIEAHQTPELTGKPSYWLLDIVLPAPVGNGSGHRGRVLVGRTSADCGELALSHHSAGPN
jgi:hypothetical protein